VFGFLGPSGAGKTTTIRRLLGLVAPTAGTCRLLGTDVRGDLHRVIDRVGAIVETPALFPTMTGRRNLELLGRVQGIGPRRVNATLERVGLSERADDLVKRYSLGMRQRLGLAAALLRGPDVLILDEPANGLDPELGLVGLVLLAILLVAIARMLWRTRPTDRGGGSLRHPQRLRLCLAPASHRAHCDAASRPGAPSTRRRSCPPAIRSRPRRGTE